MSFENYLLQISAAENTRKTHLRNTNVFLQWSDNKQPNHQLLMDYIGHCKEQGNTIHTIRLKINSLKHYCYYRLKTGLAPLIEGNPAEQIKLKGGTRKIPYNLFSSDELHEIYNLQETYGLSGKRDKVLLSLVVFQAVGSSELGRIELTDVDLIQGKIRIAASRTANERTLDLKPQQLLLFQDYITQIRPEILKNAYKNSELFLVHAGQGETQVLNNVIHRLLKRIRNGYPKIKSAQQIRQSVITEWLKRYDLRTTQYMAGHKFVSSTERYQTDQLEGLKNELKMHYVLKK